MWRYCLLPVHLSQAAIVTSLVHKYFQCKRGSEMQADSKIVIHIPDCENRMFTVSFRVKQLPEPIDYSKFIRSTHDSRHIFSYETDQVLDKKIQLHACHTVYLRKYDDVTNQLIGHNSWGPYFTPLVRINVVS